MRDTAELSMNEQPEVERERALAEARRDGAIAARRQAVRWVVAVASVVILVLVGTAAVGWTLASRAQVLAPEIIEEIATERRAGLEERLSLRSDEAQQLAARMFDFLGDVWRENESLRLVRTSIEAANAQLHLLSAEVNAAFDTPTQSLGALLENGPTRARAVLEHGIAIAAELRRLAPAVLIAVQDATAAASADGPALTALLNSVETLLSPFIEDSHLTAQWQALRHELLAWVARVHADLDLARSQMSGDALSAEFMLRLRAQLF